MDRIILLFDAHKLDISDEFSEVIKALKNHEDKIRVVLNKADQIETQQLMRVYGALMWSLGKIINTPEVVRVYIGSFWSHPLLIPDNRKLFEAEEQDLFKDIQSLPRNAALRKLNDLIKRARLAKVNGAGAWAGGEVVRCWRGPEGAWDCHSGPQDWAAVAFGTPESHPGRPTATRLCCTVSERVPSTPMGATSSQRSLDACGHQVGR